MDSTTDSSDTRSTRKKMEPHGGGRPRSGSAETGSTAGATDVGSTVNPAASRDVGEAESETSSATIRPPARLTLFGFPATPAQVELLPRQRSWRLTHGLLALIGCWVLMPIVVFIPPHVPWVLGAFFTGIYLAQRRFTEHYTLQRMDGTCPKCGASRSITKPTRLSLPLSLSCPNCHQDISLEVDLDT